MEVYARGTGEGCCVLRRAGKVAGESNWLTNSLFGTGAELSISALETIWASVVMDEPPRGRDCNMAGKGCSVKTANCRGTCGRIRLCGLGRPGGLLHLR